MASGENAEWIPDYGFIDIDDVGNFVGDFSATTAAGLYLALGGVPEIRVRHLQWFSRVPNATITPKVATPTFWWLCTEVSVSLEDTDCQQKLCSQKRSRAEYSVVDGLKASREKMRRDKLNDRFLELGSLLEPGKNPRTYKSTILCDAIRVVNQLRTEAEKLKEENEQLEEKVKELKAEKIELREEKLKLKTDKERLEQQIKAMTMPAGFVPHPAATQAAFAAQAQAPEMKPMSFMGYPVVPMWQFLPPALVDSSKDPAGVSPGA